MSYQEACPNCENNAVSLVQYGLNGKRSEEANKTLQEFASRMTELEKNMNHSYRPIEVYEHHRALYEAMIFPELSKGIKFPSTFMSVPTFCYQVKNSFNITTNSSGNVFLEFNLGQYLDESKFMDGVNKKNGTSNIGNSNLFICNDDSLDGVTKVSSEASVMVPSNIMMGKTGIFNTVRPGPTSIKYEYMGRIDIASGSATMGINFSSMNDPNAETAVNGLLPDTRYSILSALEDCPYARTVSVTETLKGIFIPHDTSVLNLKPPTDDTSTVTPQRLFLLVTSAPANHTIARITITQNWEGTPTADYADLMSLSYNTFPTEFGGREIYDYMIANNLVVTKDDSEFGLYKFT